MKPTIIVTPLYDDSKASVWMLPDYLRSIREAGGWALTLDMTDDDEYLQHVVNQADGILLTGGHDVNPSLYGQPTYPTCGPDCSTRDKQEMKLLNLAHTQDIPTLGVCRGLQMMNVFYGGTLVQDLVSETHTTVEHHMRPPYDREAHRVKIERSSLLYRAIQTEDYGVNSYHHQGIRRLGAALTVAAMAPDDTIEAAEHHGHSFMLGVLWHPEYMTHNDEGARNLFRLFVERAAQRRAQRKGRLMDILTSSGLGL